MLSTIGIVIAVVLFINQSSLSSRIAKLEKQLRERSSPVVVPQPSVGPVPTYADAAFTEPPAVKKDVVVSEETPNEATEWLRNNWLSVLGVLMVLIGFGWFVSYAFVHNWIGPVGRIALGLGLGAVLVLIGAWRMGASAVQSNILIVLGSAIVLMTAYAARVVYDFFTPELVLAFSFLVGACVTTLSAVYNREKLAVYGVLVALGAPLLTHAPEPSVVGLFAYLAVVSAASLWVSALKGWGTVNFASIVGLLLYCAPFVFGYAGAVPEDQKFLVVVITLTLALMYFVANVIGVVRNKEDSTNSAAYIAIANSILIFSVINTLAIEEMRSLLLAGWMIVFAIGSAVVSMKTEKQVFFYIYSLVATFFLGVATALELHGPVLAIAFSVEATVISVMTYFVTRDLSKGAYMSFLMFVPGALALQSMTSPAWSTGIMHDDAVVLFLASALFFALGFFFSAQYRSETHPEAVRTIYRTHTILGACFAFALIWLANHALFMDDFAVIVSLAVYTVVGIAAYLIGTFGSRNTVKYFGAVVLVLVIARLLIVDIWQMPLAPRIVVFIVIGILLVSTAFIGRKKPQAATVAEAPTAIPSNLMPPTYTPPSVPPSHV